MGLPGRPNGSDRAAVTAYKCTSAPRQFVDLFHFVRSETPVDRLDVLADLLRTGRAGNHTGNLGLSGEPTARELDHRMAPGCGERLEIFENGEALLVQVTVGQRAHRAEPRALGRFDAALVFAGEEAAGERKEGQDADAQVTAGGHQFGLDGAVEQAIFVLRGDIVGEAACARDAGGVRDLPTGVIAVADVADLAGAYEAVERFEGFLLG